MYTHVHPISVHDDYDFMTLELFAWFFFHFVQFFTVVASRYMRASGVVILLFFLHRLQRVLDARSPGLDD
jgi:hypothetical protein